MAVSGRMTDLQLTKSWHRQVSPERTKVWTESPKSDGRSVPVVYYLSRNGQLEHPHFMEVPLSSSAHGLFLRDVIGRLNVLRGKGMAAMYSWSCKRSYRNGFVWHDLTENDFIYPARGHEYVLKGSELLENSFQLPPPPPPPPENQTAAADAVYPRPPSDRRRRNQSCSSIEYEYSVYKAEPSFRSAADASTQTDDARRRRRRPRPEIVEEKSKEPQRDEIEIEISPPPSDSSPETLETLLKADGRPMLLQPEIVNKESTSGQQIQRATKSSVLMQLISCGSLSFKDCGAGQVISQYRMRVPRGGGGGGRVKLEEKEYFSGSIVETKKEELPRLKRCSSYNADR
ncbi:protein SOSEKI 5-like [Salvia miltiorrhiza]|uniref:protein SOSEKI 5-like n=1 Tax=Salvia miltiorrhiza TaxID=226208 RepID=UPI0025AD827C|nr:protein SOSEKI 5-like [Salvia miltiorrhiza]